MDLSEASDDVELHKQRETISLAGFAMCGDELLRKVFELCTGTLTGSDINIEDTLFRKLKIGCDHPAEGLVDKRFWGVKTFSPSFEGNL